MVARRGRLKAFACRRTANVGRRRHCLTGVYLASAVDQKRAGKVRVCLLSKFQVSYVCVFDDNVVPISRKSNCENDWILVAIE